MSITAVISSVESFRDIQFSFKKYCVRLKAAQGKKKCTRTWKI